MNNREWIVEIERVTPLTSIELSHLGNLSVILSRLCVETNQKCVLPVTIAQNSSYNWFVGELLNKINSTACNYALERITDLEESARVETTTIKQVYARFVEHSNDIDIVLCNEKSFINNPIGDLLVSYGKISKEIIDRMIDKTILEVRKGR